MVAQPILNVYILYLYLYYIDIDIYMFLALELFRLNNYMLFSIYSIYINNYSGTRWMLSSVHVLPLYFSIM